MPNITKYTIESILLLMTLVYCGLQFGLREASDAISTLTVFLASASRVAPAVMRIQQGFIQLHSNSAAAGETIRLFADLPNNSDDSPMPKLGDTTSGIVALDPTIRFKDVTFGHVDTGTSYRKISLSILAGTKVMVTGPSGGGKTTFIDLMIGLHLPITGEIMIGNDSPLDAITKHPGSIAYVPQDVSIIQANLRENLLLGLQKKDYSDSQLLEILEEVELGEFFQGLRNGFETILREDGSNLSGGQKQRLGLARALLTKPRLLILDEATSALDEITEFKVLDQVILKLKDSTVILVTHKTSNHTFFDEIYIVDGMEIRRE